MLGKRRWLSILLIVSLTVIGLGTAVGADSESESGFLAEINASRSANGLAPLSVDGGLVAHARNHTADMIAAGQIYHSTADELRAAAGSGWSKVGENVGRGGSVSSLHQAFMDSPGHRKNILGDYNYVGIGTGTSNGVLYVTVVFMKKGGSSSPAPSPTTTAAASGGTSAPQAEPTTTSTTTTTIPPTTTTTLIVGPDHPVTPGESCLSVARLWWMCHD